MAEQEPAGFMARLKQIGLAFSFTAKRDKWFLPLVILAGLIPIGVAVNYALLFDGSWLFLLGAVFVSLLLMLIVLNSRTSKLVMDQSVGQVGAAYAVVDTMRGWFITPGVAVSTQQDMIHRAIGKPGVVLLAEGGSPRLRNLISQEKKKLSRVVGSTPIYDFTVGEEEGQLSLRKLRKTLTKLPRNINAKQANDLNRRLNALRSSAPMPKGPVPQNMKPPKGARKAMRGR
ncbi:uncharacterized protein DUF4191 [Stackebrandtia endophytica]|uniref:Uncharacterized protein DUF4191 n=1 Tax=Stackebrandtia endophytica TaxID=1496996 RepID=A0A543ARE3_9ACTN|nr:DUF4191 domain-containing protein [Stackebrandtia endophytica]TQL75158.1 uncharacterized protein DUF4191 [Stackebrandtia endophytica]